MKDSFDFSSILIIALIALRIGLTTIPVLNTSSGFIVNFGSLAILYFIIFIKIGNKRKNIQFGSFFLLYAISFIGIAFSIFNLSKLSVELYVILQDALWFFLGFYILAINNKKQARVLLLFMAASLVYTGYTTIVGNTLFPQATRLMTTGMLEDKDTFLSFKMMNIGDFNYVYTLTLCIPVLVYLYKESLRFRIVTVLAIVGIIYITIKTEFTTALFFSLFLALFLFLPRDFKRSHIVMVLAGVLVIALVFPLVFSVLADSTSSELISERLSSLGDLSSRRSAASSDGSDLGARFEAWGTSLSGFAMHPLFGAGTPGGSHSYIFDNMCKYGIIGLFALFAVFRQEYLVYVKPYLRTDIGRYFYLIFFVNLMLCFVNTLNNIFFITLVIPLCLVAFRDKIIRQNLL